MILAELAESFETETTFFSRDRLFQTKTQVSVLWSYGVLRG